MEVLGAANCGELAPSRSSKPSEREIAHSRIGTGAAANTTVTQSKQKIPEMSVPENSRVSLPWP